MANEGVATTGRAPGAARHPWSAAAVLAATVAALVLGAGGLTAVFSRSAPRSRQPSLASHCAAPSLSSGLGAPSRLGSWPYRLAESGSFASLTGTGTGAFVALQACGAREQSLRAVRMSVDRAGIHIVASGRLERGALLTSSLTAAHGDVFLGLARLDLSGSESAPPYRLTLEKLDPSTLQREWSIALGRGYSLDVTALAEGGAIASTGRSLVRIGSARDGAQVTPLTTVTGVIRRVAIAPGDRVVALGVVRPGEVGPAAAPELETIDLDSGAVLARRPLVADADPQSLLAVDGTLWAAIGDGLETGVSRYSLPDLHPIHPAASARSADTVPVTLQTIGLDGDSGVVWVRGLTLLECADPRTGLVRASTAPAGSPPPFVSQIVGVPGLRTTLAVTSAGIGQLDAPAACAG